MTHEIWLAETPPPARLPATYMAVRIISSRQYHDPHQGLVAQLHYDWDSAQPGVETALLCYAGTTERTLWWWQNQTWHVTVAPPLLHQMSALWAQSPWSAQPLLPWQQGDQPGPAEANDD